MPPSAPPMPPGRDDRSPRRRAAELLLGDERPEHPLSAPGHVPDPEAHEARPEPAPRADGAPSLGELREERASLRRKRGADREACRGCAALAANVAASIAKTQPAPTTATITPDNAGPAIQLALRFSASSAFAFWSRARLTVCGTRPVDAGPKNDSAAADDRREQRRTATSSARSEITSTASIRQRDAARTRSHESITSRRSSRSPTRRRRRG